MAETRDSETGNHIRRAQFYVKALALKLKDHPRFAATLNPHFINLLFNNPNRAFAYHCAYSKSVTYSFERISLGKIGRAHV